MPRRRYRKTPVSFGAEVAQIEVFLLACDDGGDHPDDLGGRNRIASAFVSGLDKMPALANMPQASWQVAVAW